MWLKLLGMLWATGLSVLNEGNSTWHDDEITPTSCREERKLENDKVSAAGAVGAAALSFIRSNPPPLQQPHLHP